MVDIFQNNLLLLVIGTIGLLLLLFGAMLGYFIGQRDKGRVQQQEPEQREENNRIDERWRKIYRLTAALSTTLNYERVLDTALDLSATALTEMSGALGLLVSAVLLFDADKLIVQTARRFTSADMRASLPGLHGILGDTINKGEAILAQDVSRDPELSRIIAFHACHSAYCIPLRAGLDIYGVLLFAHPDRQFFTLENREILEAISIQAMNAIQNARLYQELEQEKERMAETQEEARKKLARDLHDGPTQSVAAIAMRVNFARRLMERNPQNAAEELFKIEDLARKTTKEIRHMLFTLRPLVLESKGLKAALETMADKMNETFGQNVSIDVDGNSVSQLDMGKQGVIFNIVDEAVNNVRKHAHASHTWVRLKLARHDIMLLEIQDDGIGFDKKDVMSSYDSRGSLGMINLRERSELISGVFQINSKPGAGTKIQVWIPLTEEATEQIWHRA